MKKTENKVVPESGTTKGKKYLVPEGQIKKLYWYNFLIKHQAQKI